MAYHCTEITITVCGQSEEYTCRVYHDGSYIDDEAAVGFMDYTRKVALTDDQRDAIAAEIREAARELRAIDALKASQPWEDSDG